MEDAILLSECSIGFKIKYFIGFIIKSTILFGISTFILLLKIIFSDGSMDSMLFIATIVLIWCVLYLAFYIITEGIIKQIISGFIISIIGTILTVIFPPLGIVLAIIGFFMMVKQIIDMVKMIPLLLLGLLLFLLLFDNELLSYSLGGLVRLPSLKFNIGFISNPINNILIDTDIIFPNRIFISYPNIAYLILSFIVAVNLGFKYRLKDAIFRQCVIFMAIPIAIIIIILIRFIAESIAESISGSLYNPSSIQSSGLNKGKIWINSYIRADGTPVAGHFRSLPRLK